MSNAKKKPLHRALAALLALVMVLTLIPWQTTALAADEAEGMIPVTITVKDGNEKPVENAIVSFTTAVKQPVEPEAKPETKAATKPQVKLLETDKNGQVVLGEATAAEIANMTISYTVSKDGYKPVTAEKAEIPADGDIQVTLEKKTMEIGVSAKPTENLVYNGEEQTLVEVRVGIPVLMGAVETTVDSGNLALPKNEWNSAAKQYIEKIQYTYTVDDESKTTTTAPKAVNVNNNLSGKNVKIKVVFKEAAVKEFGMESKEVTCTMASIAKAERNITLEAKKGLVVQGVKGNRKPQDLVTVTGLVSGDAITWTVTNDRLLNQGIDLPKDKTKSPMGRWYGNYQIRLQVAGNDNYKGFDKTVTTEIAQTATDTDGITIKTAPELVYQESGLGQNLVVVLENENSRAIKYQVWHTADAKVTDATVWTPVNPDADGNPMKTDSAQGNEPGWYEVKAFAQPRDDDEKETPVKIIQGIVAPKDEENGNFEKYEKKETARVFIDKADLKLEFDARGMDEVSPLYPNKGEEEVEVDSLPHDWNFHATADPRVNTSVSYEIVGTEGDSAKFDAEATVTNDQAAVEDDLNTPEINEAQPAIPGGKVTATSTGRIVIKATQKGNEHYKDADVQYTLEVSFKEGGKGYRVGFVGGNAEIKYVIGTSSALDSIIAADRAAEQRAPQQTLKSDEVKACEVRYSIRGKDIAPGNNENPAIGDYCGLIIKGGKITVSDMAKLIRYVEDKGQNNSLTVYVLANLRQLKENNDLGKSVGYDTYPLTIKFADPLVDANGAAVDMETKLVYTGELGSEDWYTDKVIVTAADGFSIYQVVENKAEKEDSPWIFEKKDSVTLEGDGPVTENVYIAQNSDGAVFAMHKASKKIDRKTPSAITIEFKEPTAAEKFGEWLHIYNAQATITVTAKDQTSGVKEFKVEYIKDGQEQAAETFVLPAAAKDSEGTYTAEMKLPEGELKQYRGHLRVTAIDHAGLSGVREDKKNDNIIIDGEVPVMKVYYGGEPGYEAEVNTVGDIHYYNADTKAEFVVTEDNFRVENMKVTVVKDGKGSKLPPKWAEGDPYAAPDAAQAKPAHVGTMTLKEDGDYQIKVTGKDAANNAMADYTSETIQIDTKAPVLNKAVLTPADYSAEGVFYHKGSVTFLFTLQERNFYPDEVVLEITKNGEKMTTLPAITWYDEVPEELEKKVGELEKYEHLGVMTLEAQADHSADGDYIVTLNYTDRATNAMETYTSEQHTIDTLLNDPVVTYEPMEPVLTKKDSEKHDRQYFAGQRVATVVIDEHNFDPERVVFTIDAKDVSGKDVKNEKNVVLGEWVSEGDKRTMTITYPGDANYTFDMKYSDLATNEYDGYEKDYFTVDTTKPVTKSVKYSAAVLDTMVHSEEFGFYNAVVTVTITAEDPTSGVESFLYSYRNAPGVSQVNKELIDKAISAAQIQYSDDNKTASAQFKLPAKLVKDTQFNGKVDFTATDRSGNVSKKHQETKRIVVDNIAPIADISFNKPVNVVNGVHYYAGNINAVVSVNEANFFQNDVVVMVSKDGGAATRVSPKWRSAGGDIHNGTFTITGDGDYVVTVAYTDKSSNKMTSYKSAQMTIDTQIKAPTFSINGASRNENGGSYKKDAVIGFAFNDRNFASKTIQLMRTNFDSRVDVTDQFVKVNGNSKGGAGSFAIPAKTVNDGIYTMTVSISDKANHTAKSTMNFTVNRFGSVYEYSDSLVELIRDGGQYVTAVEEDLVITEYNADKIKNGSLKIMITRDGEAIDVDYKAVPVNGGGWNKYVYTIDADNFKADGLYKISVSSAYPTSDSDKNESASVPENSVNEKGGKILDKMSFTVDTQKPEIRNIVNMDEPIVNATELKVKYNIVDVGGIQAIEVLVNGASVDKVTEFGDDVLNYNGEFTLKEMSDAQVIQLRITDRAGNITDTAAEDFNAEDLAFEFNNKVTVSTSFFVRWYANKGLFWGSICGVVVLAGAIWYLVAGKRRKNNGSAQ